MIDRALPRVLVLVLMLATASTAARAQSSPLFTLMPPAQTGVSYANTIVDDDYHNIIDFIYAYNGSGVAAGDVNGDGLVDLFFSGTQVPNRLYLNRGGFRFEDATAASGLLDSTGMRNGVAMVDIDADGDLDIYVCKQEHPNTLFINDGAGRFTERARAFGLAHDTASTAAAFLDYDRDGDLDVYLVINGDGRGEHYVKRGLPDKLYRNNGDGTFSDVSSQAGIHDVGYGLSATVGDIDNDGDQDIFVANDFEARSLLWINNGDGTFTESMKERMGHSATFAMGTDIADFNNDGHLDMVEVDMLPEDHERKNRQLGMSSVYSPLFDSLQHMRNGLYLNRGDGTFRDIAYLAGVAKTDWSWASFFVDFDLDGWKDLFIANGIKRDLGDQDYLYSVDKRVPKLEMLKRMPVTLLQNYVFRNRRDLTFEDLSDGWGLTERVNTQGAAYADLDNDGDVDLVLNNVDTAAFIYRNNAVEQRRGRWLRVGLEGPKGNRFGIGSRVRVTTHARDGRATVQVHEQQASRGYLSSVEPVLSFGFPEGTARASVDVRWADGTVTGATVDRLDTMVTVAHSGERITLVDTASPGPGMIDPRSIGLDFRHDENPFSDFDRERLLPNRLSQGGPGIAVGDVDGNGFDDLYVGGAKFQAGALYLQQPDGRFTRTSQPAFEADERSEDMGALFCDVDGDRDLDLYVVSGGSDFEETSPELQDRLYRNDGRGRFTKDTNALPPMRSAGSSVVAADYDRDGDVDLFVAGRVVPGRYPAIPRSYLLENRKGRFVDATERIAPGLVAPGMISAALWSDYDNDGDPDLLLAGEWTTPLLFRNDRGRFVAATSGSGLDSAHGWWTSLTPGDIDNDGDVDYVAGNWGLNTRYQPTSSEPIELWVHDFDGNGSVDPIMTYWYEGKRYPTRDKQSVASQIPSISRRFPKFYQYARATFEQLLPKDSVARARRFAATTFSTSILVNLGGGRFEVRALPLLAQAAPVFGTSVDDLDGDGNLDLLLVGNFHGPEPEMKRYDALGSLVLQGDGRGGFVEIPTPRSGFAVVNNSRALVRLADRGASRTRHVVSTCNDALYVFDAPGVRGTIIDIDPRATHAIVKLADGRMRREELECGGGYLSQSSSALVVPPGARLVTLYDGTRKLKEIRP